MRVISPFQLIDNIIFEEFVDFHSPLARRILDRIPMEVPYFHIIYGGRRDPYIIAYCCYEESSERERIESSLRFAQLVQQANGGSFEAVTPESLVFICTVYFQFTGKVDLLSVIRDYQPEEHDDPVGRLLRESYGRLVYDYQLMNLCKLAKPRMSLEEARDFVNALIGNPNPNIPDLKLSTGETLAAVIERYSFEGSIMRPEWNMAASVKQVLQWGLDL